MTNSFTQLLGGARFDGENFSLTIPDDWMQGRTTYGGLTAALCYETAARRFPGAPPLRSAMVSFIGPTGGCVEGSARILRQGKSVTFVEADIVSEKGLATRCVFGFGAGRDSIFNASFIPAVDLPGPDGLEPYIPEGMGPNFAQHFETRFVKGGRPGTGSDAHEHFLWVRHRDEGATSLTALLALADMPPPAVMPMFKEFSPISSMTWMVNMLTAAPQTKDGWWLLSTRAENAAEGYSSQDMLIWNRDFEPVITGRQSVAIFQ